MSCGDNMKRQIATIIKSSNKAYQQYETQITAAIAAQERVDLTQATVTEAERMLKETENECLLPEYLAGKEGQLNGANETIRSIQAAQLLKESPWYQTTVETLNTVKANFKNAQLANQEAGLRLTAYRHRVALVTAQLELLSASERVENHGRQT